MLFAVLHFILVQFSPVSDKPQRIFDVHVHGSPDMQKQMNEFRKAGVYKAAISTSWGLQQRYRDVKGIKFLQGLMFPCPLGKVPYSNQPCFTDGKEWPTLKWVEQQLKNKKIDFFGEVLSQYYGISSSDTSLYPYYRLAKKYKLPVGIHTGGAGPDHGSPNFKMELGDPTFLEKMLADFPGLKLWIMHAGDMHYQKTIELMKAHPNVYTDISVINFPGIVPPDNFTAIMKDFIDAGLEDRLMFGSDNFDISAAIKSIQGLDFLSAKQKDKIFYENAERFFRK